MFRIDTPNKAVDLFGPGKHGFRDGDMTIPISATELSAAQQNALQEELAGICEAAGIVLNKANNTQVLEAIQRLIDAQSGNYALDTGAANAYVVALSPAITAYADGMTVRFKIANGNTGASTLNAGAGVVPLLNDAGGALVLNDVSAGSIATAIYIASATGFYLTSMVQSQGDARYSKLTDFAKLAAAKGYQKLPGGLIIQWGMSGLIPSNTGEVQTFAMAFPTVCYVAVITSTNGTGTATYGTGFNYSVNNFSINNNSTISTNFAWIAIGY